MFRTNADSPRERCAEHDLAVGPAGECVLCRRARSQAGPGGRPRWLGPVLLAASLGTLLLGGAALARTRPPSAPVLASVAPEEVVRPVPVPLEVRPAAMAPVSPHEVLTSPPPRAAPPIEPPRNYLDEAYAAMPKGNLYDETPSQPGSTAPACPCRTTGCQPRYYGYGTARMHSGRVATTPPVQVQVQQASAPPPVAMYGRSGGSFSHGVAVARR